MQHLFKFLILVVLFSSCKKEFHFSKDEITETDASGNLVGNINPNDWKLKSISDLTDFEKKVLLQIPLNFETSKDTIYKNIKSCENVPSKISTHLIYLYIHLWHIHRPLMALYF